MTQNQVSTSKLKGKLEGLKFSCLFSRRKRLGLEDSGRREIEARAFATVKEKKKRKKIFLHAFLREALAQPPFAACSPAAAHELMEMMKPRPPQPGPRASGFS